MKNKNRLLLLYSIITGVFMLYIGFVYFKQTTQATIITNPDNFQIKENLHVSQPNKNTFNKLKKLGFQDISIYNMSKDEIQQYEQINGKIVDSITIYMKISKNDLKYLSKANYQKLLKQYSSSTLPRKTTLGRVYLHLVYEGERKFLVVSEHQFDFIPSDLKPMQIELQLRNEYNIISQNAKQVWWTSSLFNTNKINTGMDIESPNSTAQGNSDEFNLFNEGETGTSTIYNVSWKQSNILDEVVGLYFYNTAEFEVPKDFLITDVYIQGQNPHLSLQLFYEFKSKK
ncbi:hypothetical protein ACQKP0_18500 [Heyndrickxia sp. NPDC080065]|uniref:hypothetical protein n=1 Tax=Heyndrickxia sp. NPDC080065 TaxID=3390568 RepID=UPI003D057607